MVSLQKNQTISLSKSTEKTLTRIAVGLGWDPVEKKKGLFAGLFGGGTTEIDLDASVIMLDAEGNAVDYVWWRKLESNCKALVHRGDNQTGDGDGDDEIIDIDLTALPANVEYLAITVNSFRGQTFDDVENAFCRVFDTTDNNKELCHFKLTEQGQHTGILIGSLRRKGGAWEFTARALPCNGKTVEAMLPVVRQAVLS